MTRKFPKFHKPFGLRTVKTAIAVTLAVLLTRCFSTASSFYAALGAMTAMDRTISDSLKNCVTQLMGVILGGVIGYLIVLAFGLPQAWIVGLATVLMIVLCNRLKMPYAISLSCIVMFSICLEPGDSILYETFCRLRDTSIGLLLGVVVNITVRPYNNTRRIISLLQRVIDLVPQLVQSSVLHEKYPDLRPMEAQLEELAKEIRVFRRQRFLRRKKLQYDAVYFEGCQQLALRIHQELSAICCMDTFGNVGVENRKRLSELGIQQDEPEKRKCTKHDTIVMNYHLEKLLDARKYLQQLLPKEPPARWWQFRKKRRVKR